MNAAGRLQKLVREDRQEPGIEDETLARGVTGIAPDPVEFGKLHSRRRGRETPPSRLWRGHCSDIAGL